MSTRVQKGGPIFRPVAKPRGLATAGSSRQPSVAADLRNSATPSGVINSVPPVPVASIAKPRGLATMGSSSWQPSVVGDSRSAATQSGIINSVPHAPTASITMPPPTVIPSTVRSASRGAKPIVTPAPSPHVPLAPVPLIVDDAADAAEIQIVQKETSEGASDHATEPVTKKRKRRASSVSRKSRKPSHPPFDPDADPGEELDPTVVTMATLCSDTGQGRISSKAVQIQTNHAAWKASNREKRARMKMLMETKKYGKKEGAEETNPNGQGTSAAPAEPIPITSATAGPSNGSDTGAQRAQSTGPSGEDETGHGFDYSQTMSTSRFNVQVRIGPNGETIIDEESLFVDRNDENETVNYTHVEESDTTKFVNSSTYGKKFRGSRWSAEETELFFDALSQFGENYELISYVLPGRDRKACKNKFKAEDRKNSNRITYCLNNRVPYDIQTLSRMTGKDFSGPTPEIRAPAVLSLAEPEPEHEHEHEASPPPSRSVRKKSRTPGIASDGAEVLGDAASFAQDES